MRDLHGQKVSDVIKEEMALEEGVEIRERNKSIGHRLESEDGLMGQEASAKGKDTLGCSIS